MILIDSNFSQFKAKEGEVIAAAANLRDQTAASFKMNLDSSISIRRMSTDSYMSMFSGLFHQINVCMDGPSP